jgi:hypothetical protein
VLRNILSDDLIYDFTTVFNNIIARIYCSLPLLHHQSSFEARFYQPNAIGRCEIHQKVKTTSPIWTLRDEEKSITFSLFVVFL